MFGIFQKAKISLALDQQVYAPGDTVQAHITLQNDKEMAIQGGRFTITCQQKYQYRRKGRDSDGHTHVEKTWGTRDSEVYRLDFLSEMPLPAGTHTFEASFPLEEGALPTSKGNIISVAWFAKATLDRKMAADANSEVPFILLTTNPPGGVAATTGEYGTSNEPEEAQMSLLIRTKEVTGGITLAGTLRVNPQKDIGVSEVRVQLVRDEYVGDVANTGYDNRQETTVAEVKVVGKTQLQAGIYVEYPFSLQIPQAAAPTVAFSAGYLRYQLKGILARSLRKDTHVEEEITVYAC